MRKSRFRMSKIDRSSEVGGRGAATGYSRPVERGLDGVLEHGDVAEFMAEHQRQPGQEQRLAFGPAESMAVASVS